MTTPIAECRNKPGFEIAPYWRSGGGTGYAVQGKVNAAKITMYIFAHVATEL